MGILANRLRRISKLLKPSGHQIRQGNRARNAGEHARAAMLYARALRKAPYNAPIHIQAGHMFKESGDPVSAERHYLHALALQPDDRDVHLQLAHFYKSTNRLQQAYAHFVRLSEVDPAGSRDDLKDIRRTLNIQSNAGYLAAPNEITPDIALASGLVDQQWYRRTYPDIGSANPLDHFMGLGRYELRHPGPGFDPHWYLRSYPQIIASGLDPFSHYLLIGRTSNLKPIGPAGYPRWIADHDTLDDEDRKAIEAHILDAGFKAPAVLVAVDADTAPGLGRAIDGLRRQWLKSHRVHLCLAADCPPAVRRTARALVGSDGRFRIVDAGHPFEDVTTEGPVVLIDAAVELREHALYMLAQAATEGVVLVYADHDRIDGERVRHSPIFKPDASPQLLRQVDYIGACGWLAATAIERMVGDLVSGERSVTDILRSVMLGSDRTATAHVPFILYHDHVERQAPPSPRTPRSADAGLPNVTVIIPTRDRLDLLRPCIESLRGETDYPLDLIDIVVVDNNSTEDETLDWLAAETAAGHLRTLHAPVPFNYPLLNNMAAETSTADVLLLLNNDTEVQDPDWLRVLVGYATQPDVGAVGPMLLYDDGTIQHAGVVLGVGGVAAHAHAGIAHDAPGFLGFAQRTREVAAVTGACLAMRRSVFEEIGGLDVGLPVAFNDVLLCLAAVDRGYRNIYVHDVWVRHYESKTRGLDDTIAKVKIFNREARYARDRYPGLFQNDPWYSPNLSFDLPDMYELAFPPRVVRPWQAYKRDHQRPHVLLLSAALELESEIGTAVALQARYLSEHGYHVEIGAPYSVLKGRGGTGLYQMLENGRDAADYAVRASCDIIVAHTANYGDVSRWLGKSPPVILHYHGERGEASSGVPKHVFQHEGRLLALPFVAHVIAASPAAAAALSLPDATILPPGADRLGVWSSHLMPLRDGVRRERDWTGKTVVLLSTIGRIDTGLRESLPTLIAEFDARSVVFALLAEDQVAAAGPPTGMIAIVSTSVADRQALMVAADVFWEIEGSDASIGMNEATALGMVTFNAAVPTSPEHRSTTAQALAERVEAVGGIDAWSRRAGTLPGWADTLSRFRSILQDHLGAVVEVRSEPE